MIRRSFVAAALCLAAQLAAPAASAAEEPRRTAAILVETCRAQLAALGRTVDDRWAFAQMRLAADTWRALDCAALYGLTARDDRAEPRVRWIIR